MTRFDRREFLQMSVASLLAPNFGLGEVEQQPAPVRVAESHGIFRAEGNDYVWEWTQDSDQVRLLDKHGFAMLVGKLQAAVMVQPSGARGSAQCSPGKVAGVEPRADGITVSYEGLNGGAKLVQAWRFEEKGFWLEPLIYETSAPEDVLSLHYFSQGDGARAHPSLQSDYVVLPGAMQCSVLNPVIPMSPAFNVKLDQAFWMGRDYIWSNGFLQQWGLPVHYFCAFHRSPYDFQQTPQVHLPDPKSDSDFLDGFCCGLADLPNGDLFFESAMNRYAPYIDYRSDLWGHQRGPGRLTLGARLYWAVGPNYYEAIRRYYRGLLASGVIQKKENSPRKNAIALAPAFDTWGAQVAINQNPDDFDEPTLNAIYEGMKQSRIEVKNFVIDGFWENKYGDLAHSEKRFPHFEQTLERIRSDGYYVGLWAAFMRCEDPAELGLGMEHMMRLPEGKPFVGFQGSPVESRHFYILDVTQPQVQTELRTMAKRFMERYKPDFIKFDFGYELPSLGVAAPKDMTWAGERILLKGLEVVVGALREVNPDIAIVYYSLSPLLIDYIDLHSPDDMYISLGEYDLEANRRFFFSSLLGELGMPTWGSGGYDWLTSPEIWFDSSVLGSVGSLGAFSGPLPETLATPERVAKFNGLSRLVRTANAFSIVPVDADFYGPVRGAHCSSWARVENGETVMVALRNHRLTGGNGSRKYRDLVSANCSLVVASRSHDGIAQTLTLGVVPYGDGELVVKRDSGSHANVIEHLFGGGSQGERLPVRGSELRIPLRERSEQGTPIEWLEINVHLD